MIFPVKNSNKFLKILKIENYFTDKNSRFVRFAFLTKSISATNWLAGIRISFDDRYRVDTWNDPRYESNSTYDIIDVHNVSISFCCAIEFTNARNVESFYKLRPNLWTKPGNKRNNLIKSSTYR